MKTKIKAGEAGEAPGRLRYPAQRKNRKYSAASKRSRRPPTVAQRQATMVATVMGSPTVATSMRPLHCGGQELKSSARLKKSQKPPLPSPKARAMRRIQTRGISTHPFSRLPTAYPGTGSLSTRDPSPGVTTPCSVFLIQKNHHKLWTGDPAENGQDCTFLIELNK